MATTNEEDDDSKTILKIQSAHSNLKTLLITSSQIDSTLEKIETNLEYFHQTLTTASKRIAPLQSLSIAKKALDARINRAVSPAMSLLESFNQCETLQRMLTTCSTKLSNEKSPKKRLRRLKEYVGCVNNLNLAINSISIECEPGIQRLQEVVEFLSRTKVADQYRTLRLRETLVTLKALYENEVDGLRFDGLLDEALLSLQDEYEGLLLRLRHGVVGEERTGDGGGGDGGGGEMVVSDLGSQMEVEVLKEISETLAANDCLDICIDIFVKVRYRRAAKALMRLNPDYLRTYTPEEIDEMQWENLETSISLWIQHFELAVKTVLVSEKNLSNQVMGGLMDGLIWDECFVKVSDKIMAVFFRFGEGVARSSKEPQKLFKLLDMFKSLENLQPDFSEVFGGEAGADISLRFRELEKLIVHGAAKVFWEFGLQIEGNQDGFSPPADGSVPKLVRYAINYLKYLVTDAYSSSMASVLQIEQMWKAGVLAKPETDENLLKDAVTDVMEALHRNIEAKRLRYKDKALTHIFAMNTYWYIYMRVRSTELGKLVGELYMKKKYKVVAEEAAYLYQKQAWGSLVRLLERDDSKKSANEEASSGALAKGKIDAFLDGFNEVSQRHKSIYAIADVDLREQIREATVKLVVPAYADFLTTYKSVLQLKSYHPPESIEGLLLKIFGGRDRERDRKLTVKDRKEDRQSISGEGGSSEMKDLQRFKSNTNDG